MMLSNVDNQQPYGEGIQPHWIIVATVCIILGLFFVFAAFQYFMYTMGAVGFIFASSVTWLILTLAEPKEGYPSVGLVYVGSCMGAGLVVSLLAMYFWPITLPLMGWLAGFVLGMYVYMWREDHILLNIYARMFTAAGMGTIMAILTYIVESMIVVLATSVLGGFLFILGIDMLVHTGLVQAIRSLFNANPFHTVVYHVDHKIYAMLSAILVIIFISVALQMHVHNGRRFGINLIPVLEPPVQG
ncbi:uncharacterized protein BX664DRAFT_21030 [Halteromyces radiatus]|uniref:uncharacterized protein n=1 Tax=Halteromyces radiatus TaxID=101107 RepID=UPI00221E5FAB|nr:uncharacterized protein BX664DRAFT_21030 [Halteromyces radiatus]KAI8099432.1 hypothetical protein BX664DRAFT_21030 [Halteromyces radiatus]